jgi:hypothetical protein
MEPCSIGPPSWIRQKGKGRRDYIFPALPASLPDLFPLCGSWAKAELVSRNVRKQLGARFEMDDRRVSRSQRDRGRGGVTACPEPGGKVADSTLGE